MSGAGSSTPSAAPILSMTGVGAGSAALRVDPPGDERRVEVQIRAVNHRYLDVRVRAPQALAGLAPHAEDVVRRRLLRGRIEVTVTLEGGRRHPTMDLERAERAFQELARLRDRIAPGEPLPLALLASVPGLYEEPSDAIDEPLRDAVVAATEAACRDVEAARAREGAALRADVEPRLAGLLEIASRIEGRLPRVLDEARERLRVRVSSALGGAHAIDPSRLEQEIVLLADRSDVTEELTRLRAHVREGERLLAVSIEGRGKRLDFLCQELAREANTLGQKSSDAWIAAEVIGLKAEIERIREQIQNLL